MINNIEDTYKSLIDFFEDIALNSNNVELTNQAKTSYMTYAKVLCTLKKIDIKEFEERIKNIDSKKINIEYNFNNKLDEYILNNIYKNEDKKLSDKFQQLVDKLILDLKNPNELLITTWINNYLAFVNKYSNILDAEKMKDYMRVLFNKYDKSGIYTNNLKKYLKKHKVIDEIKSSNDNILYKQEVPKDKNINEEQQENKKQDKIIIKPEIINNEKYIKNDNSLEIKSIKKSNLKPSSLKTIKRFSLVGIAATLGLGTSLMTFIIYKAFNRKGALDKRMSDILNNIGFGIDDTDQKEITKEEAEKEKYKFMKNKLIEINEKNDKGNIKKEYKKNKLASILLNSKIVKSLKNKEVKKQDKEIVNNKNELMYKGLGNV